MIRRLLVALATLTLLSGCAAANPETPTTTPQPPTIGLTYIPNVQFSPFYLAESDGDFQTAGVKPVLRHHGASEGLFTALVSGQEQFVVAGGDEMLQARAQGADLVAVSAYYHQYPAVVIVPTDSPIQQLADLKGHTIGIPGKFGENWFALLVALKNAGLSEADVAIKEIGYTQQAALSTHKVDAIVGFSNNDAVQFELAGFPTRNLAIADGQVPLVSISLITTADYAQRQPQVVKQVVAGMLAGVKTAVSDPDHAMQVSASYIPGLQPGPIADAARATLVATAKLWTDPTGAVSGQLDAQQWSAMAGFMADHDLLGGQVDAASAMSNDFLPAPAGR